jgi:hypothetical protein
MMRWLGFGVDAVVSRMVYTLAGAPSALPRPGLGFGISGGSGNWAGVADPGVDGEELPALEQPGIKLVRYALISLRPCAERILPGGTGEVLVTGRVSRENFAVGTVVSYLESHEIRHEDEKYLRVYCRVLERWPRQPLRCREDEEVTALQGIRSAILEYHEVSGSGWEAMTR